MVKFFNQKTLVENFFFHFVPFVTVFCVYFLVTQNFDQFKEKYNYGQIFQPKKQLQKTITKATKRKKVFQRE